MHYDSGSLLVSLAQRTLHLVLLHRMVLPLLCLTTQSLHPCTHAVHTVLQLRASLSHTCSLRLLVRNRHTGLVKLPLHLSQLLVAACKLSLQLCQ